MSLLSWYVRWKLKSAALEAIDDLAYQYFNIQPIEVDAMKTRLCNEIQSQRKIPGELRRWACSVVRDITVADAVQYLNRLRAVVKSW